MTPNVGSLVRLYPRPRQKGYEDVVDNGCIRLWSEDTRKHVPVPVGATCLVVGVLPTSYLSIAGSTPVVNVLTTSPGVGPVVVSSYADRLKEPE